MKYAKLIDGEIQLSPNPILHNGLWVGNPAPETLTAEGFKPVTRTEQQGEAPEGYEWRATWTETVSEIVQGWEAVEIPPEPEPTAEEALKFLLEGDAEYNNGGLQIVVPDALYDSWIATTNWSNSNIKAKIIKASEYEGGR